MHEEFDLTAPDGTRLTAWRNETVDSPHVLVCNGMAVPPQAWPRLLDSNCEFSFAGWNHRGVYGSDRPQDENAIHIEHHVEDAVALLDDLGWDNAIVVSWSLGVNVAFELAHRHPERVQALLGVAGVPGGTFDTLFAPQFVPRSWRRPLGLGVARAGKAISPALNLLARNIPTGRPLAEVLRFSGVVLPHAHHDDVADWAGSMFKQDFNWYFHLALGLAEHEDLDPSFIKCPVTVVGGSVDFLTSGDDVLKSAARIPHAEVHKLPGTHCLPLEFPDEILEMLRDLNARAQWQESLAEARKAAGVAGVAGVAEEHLADDEVPLDLEDDTDEQFMDLRDPDFIRS